MPSSQRRRRGNQPLHPNLCGGCGWQVTGVEVRVDCIVPKTSRRLAESLGILFKAKSRQPESLST